MSSPRWRKILRDLWLHRTRSALAILAMVVGLAGSGSVLDTWALIRRATTEGYRATNPPAAVLTIKDGDSTLLGVARGVTGVGLVEGRRTMTARIFIKGSWQTALLYSSPLLGKERVGVVTRETGSFPAPPGGLTLESSSVGFAGAGVGDSITLHGAGGRSLSLRVDGIAQDRGLAPGWMDHVVYAFVGAEVLDSLGAPPFPSQLRITVAPNDMGRAEIRGIAATVETAVKARGATVMHVDVPVPGEHVHAGQMNSLLLIQGAFGALSLALSAFLMINLMSSLLASQRREIGIMKTLGAGPRDLVIMYLAFAIALGLVSAAFAIPLAALIARPYAAFAAGLLNFSVDGFAIPRAVLLLQAATALVLPLAAAAVPVMSTALRPVAEALRGGVLRPLPDWLLRMLSSRRLTRPVLLSVRNAVLHRQRFIVTVFALALGGAVFMAALALRQSVHQSVAHLYEDLMQFDGVVRFASYQSIPDAEAKIRAVRGVQEAEAWSTVRAAITVRGQVANTFGISGVPPSTHMLNLPAVEGRWLRVGDQRALVVSRELLHGEPDLVVGGTISLLIAGKGTTWTVIGVVPVLGRVAYADREMLASVLGESRTEAVAVKTSRAPQPTDSAVFRKVRDALEQSGIEVSAVQVMSATRAASEDHVLMVVDFLLVVAQLTILVAALGLASTMSIAVMERTREIGVMRAVGAGPRAIIGIVEVEGLAIAALSVFVAIPLSVPMTFFLGEAFGRVMFPVAPRFAPPWMALGIWMATALVTAAIACLWPAWQATRISAARALAYE